ncbi:MAG: serine/threonine protein kinase, partial [Labilithrix sp.]|nr:serine/threonine protein kinase [Labilithrix sp.]
MPSSPTQPASSAPVQEGDILASKYRVEKVLGVGGMGVVVAAHHVDLDQKVALKFLLPAAATNEELVNRFLREARASVRLKGSHVAKVLDVGRLEDSCPYIVMEFLDGNDLHAVIRARSGPIAIEDAVSYLLHAAEGLAEAHALGIVHRDLKPGNLFLTRGVDGRPLVKVLDFGISKTIDTSIGGDQMSLTKTEMLLGSPLYMSPEQMRSSKHVDERSDLWALGAIGFELLTGKVPFEADTILELCFKVAQESVPNPKDLRPDLPDGLCAAILRCLEKDPAARHANVGELAHALEPFGPARDRGTAERALDVLGTGRRPPMRSLPAMEAASPSGGGVTPMPSSPEIVAAAAWGTTQAQTTTRSRRGIIALGGAIVVVAAIAGVAVSRGRSPEAAGPTPSASASVASAGEAPFAPPAMPELDGP